MAETDTLGSWLYRRFGRRSEPWNDLLEAEREHWQHHANAVRRAAQRGGFKDPGLAVTEHGTCISCPGGCPVALCVCGHQYHGHASLDMGPRRCLNCTGRCTKYQAAS